MMEKLMDPLQKVLTPMSEKLSANKYMMSLGQTFQLLLPVIMIGSFSALFAFVNFPPWQRFITETTNLRVVFMTAQSLTLSIIALYVVLVLSYLYGQKLEINPITSFVLSMMFFLLLTPHQVYNNIPLRWLGYTGLFTALIVAGLVPRFIKLLIDKRIYIRMPAGVPKIVEDSFASIVPAFFILVIGLILSFLFASTRFESVHNIIYQTLQTPLQRIGLTLPAYLAMQILTTLLMFMGIHGNTVFATFTPLTMAASAENLAALAAGQNLPHIIVGSFSVFAQPGSIGSTFSLAILLLVLAKSKRLRTLGKLAIIPAIFGINEPLIFGIPILLNPLLFIPYVFNPIFNTVCSYTAIAIGIVPRLTGAEVAWSTPQFISGFLAVGPAGTLLQIFNVSVNALVWFPFFKIVDKQALASEQSALLNER